jgi:peptide-methionine (S)-S-oxide reductase
MTQQREVATLGGGCFWCLEAVYEQLHGVDKVVSGYAGGHVPNPTYKQVCAETTGHAEVVQVTFDPSVTSYREILEVFFTIHDPTTMNRQGNDEGTQYRSAIFTHGAAQEKTARDLVAELTDAKAFDDPIVTEIVPFREFFAAEDYHQGYYRNNPSQGYCMAVVRPKLQKFKKAWTAKLKA